MASRFLLQKLSSGMFRSTSRLGAHASACARAAAPVARTAPEGGTRTLSNLFHGAAVHPGMAVTSSRGIQGYAARYFNTVSFSCTDAKANQPATGMSSILINRVKPAYMDSVNGAKRTFSSGASNRHDLLKPETDIKAYGAALDRDTSTIVVLSTLIGITWFYSEDGGKSSNRSRNNSGHCSGCSCVAGG
ncbi:unnamed protein product [Urochloa humidicola]